MASFNFSTTRQPMLGKRERLAVDGVASITPAVYTVQPTVAANQYGKNDRQATAAVLQVFTDAIYFTLDGSTPSALVGFEAAVGDEIYLDSYQKIKGFKAIKKTLAAEVEVLPMFGN